MRRVSFGYVVQLQMDGFPIKVGMSRTPERRLTEFVRGTPVEAILIGVTINGYDREKEMLDAVSDTMIKSEWAYPNWKIQDLLNKWHEAGEWYALSDDKQKVFDTMDVARRIGNAPHLNPTQSSCQYRWASEVLNKKQQSDPLLGLHWAGFVQAETEPKLNGLSRFGKRKELEMQK